MVTKREVADAQRRVLEAVEDWFPGPPTSPGLTVEEDALADAYREWDRLRKELDGQGPAVARSTSIAAAKGDIMLKQSKRREILVLLVQHYQRFHDGLTADQILARMSGRHQSISARVSELANIYGLIKDSGRKRNTSLGKKAIVWEPTEEAIELVAAAVTGRGE